MEDRTWMLVLVILLWIAAQFGLALWALRDLWRRPRVRGDNKMVWVLLILILPVIGPLIYSSLGPTSFLPRPGRAQPPVADPEDR
ncbi:MAG: PLD nuclease N-terminal domain-containing protein [Dehalococcoidia bacterium]